MVVKSWGLLVVAVLHIPPVPHPHRFHHVVSMLPVVQVTEQCQPVQVGLAMVLFQQVILGPQQTPIVVVLVDHLLRIRVDVRPLLFAPHPHQPCLVRRWRVMQPTAFLQDKPRAREPLLNQLVAHQPQPILMAGDVLPLFARHPHQPCLVRRRRVALPTAFLQDKPKVREPLLKQPVAHQPQPTPIAGDVPHHLRYLPAPLLR